MAAPFKLTVAESAALIQALQADVGYPAIVASLVEAIGEERATNLIRQKGGVKLSPADTLALVKAVFARFPGDTSKDKILRALTDARAAFADDARFAAAVAYVKERIDRFAAEGLPQEAPAGTLQPFGQGTIPIYMKTLHWWEDLSRLRAELAICARHRVGYGMELGGDSVDKVLLDPAKLARVEEAWNVAVSFARANGLWIYAAGPNDNMGSGKYGDPGIKLSQCLSGASFLLAMVKKTGPENIIFTPVVETQSSAGKSFEAQCVRELPGFRLWYNGNGGHPSSRPSGFDGKVQHPASPSEAFSPGDGVVGDNGPFIVAMQGSYDGSLNVSKNAAWFAAGAARGYPFMAAYAFKRAAIDEAGIASCSLAKAQVPQSGAYADEIDLTGAVWHHIDGSKARVTQELTALSFDGKMFRMATTPGTRAWTPFDGDCNQYACFFVFRNGRWEGGKFEHQRPGNDARSANNIREGYIKGLVPVAGEAVGYLQINRGLSERTNCRKVVWK